MNRLRWMWGLCCLTLLSGCAQWLQKSSPEANAPASNVNAPTAGPVAAPASEPVVLKALISDDLDIPKERIESAVRLFEQTSGCEVSLETASSQDIAGRLSGRAFSGSSASSNEPAAAGESYANAASAEEDVVMVDTRTFGEMLGSDRLAPIEPEMAADLRKSPASAAFESRGSVYALPVWADARVLVYNPAHLAAAGLPPAPPASLGDLRKQAGIVKRRGVSPAPYYAWWSDEGIVQEFLTWLGSYRGAAFDQEGRPIFMQEQGKKALQFMISMAEGGLLNRDAASDEHHTWEAAVKGGHTFGACWLSDLDALPGPYSIALLPVSMETLDLDRTFATSLAVYKGLGVSAASKHPKEAGRLAAFLAVSLKSPRLQGLEEASDKYDPVQAVGRLAFAQARPALSIARRNEAVAILARNIRAAVDKTTTVESALNQAGRDILNLRGGAAAPAPEPQSGPAPAEGNMPPAGGNPPPAQENPPATSPGPAQPPVGGPANP